MSEPRQLSFQIRELASQAQSLPEGGSRLAEILDQLAGLVDQAPGAPSAAEAPLTEEHPLVRQAVRINDFQLSNLRTRLRQEVGGMRKDLEQTEANFQKEIYHQVKKLEEELRYDFQGILRARMAEDQRQRNQRLRLILILLAGEALGLLALALAFLSGR